MDTPLGIDAFLNALRNEGVPVGHVELSRLHHAFSLQPRLDSDQLRHLLRCTLVKSGQQREYFEPLFEDWLVRAESRANGERSNKEAVRQFNPTVNSKQRRLNLRGIPLLRTVGLSMILAVAASVSIWILDNPSQLSQVGRSTGDSLLSPGSAPNKTVPSDSTDDPLGPVSSFWTWVPSIEKVVANPSSNPWASNVGWGLLSLAPLAAGAVLLLRHRWSSRLPSARPPLFDGPDWLPFLSSDSKPIELMKEEDRRNLVWGVNRFVSEDLSRRIDLGASVRETARAAGIPVVCREPLSYSREVWIWQDALSRDRVVERLSGEIEKALKEAGLSLRSGIFYDLPDAVRWHEGQEFDPATVEGHRQSAIVCILCDGSGLRLAYESSNRREGVVQLLRGLGEWPRLAFVDCGEGRHGLGRLLHPYGLAVIDPADLPSFLGAQKARPGRLRGSDGFVSGDLRAWAAALALAPEPPDAQTALEVRAALGLDVPALDLRRIESRLGALRQGDRLAWRQREKAELLNWLSALETDSDEQSSLLQATVSFWLVRCRSEDTSRRERQKQEHDLHSWEGTLAQRQNELRQALLRLWIEPKDATEQLYRLHQVEDLGPDVRKQLRRFAPRDLEEDSDRVPWIRFPWQWNELEWTTQRMLWEMDLAGRPARLLQPASARIQGSLSLAAGLCIGLGLAAGLYALGVSPSGHAGRPQINFTSEFRQDFFEQRLIAETIPQAGSRFGVAAGEPRCLEVLPKTARSQSKGEIAFLAGEVFSVNLGWSWEQINHAEDDRRLPGGESEIWRAGSLPQPIRASEEGWPRRSLMVLGYQLTSRPARQLAIQLLDQGSVDAVLIGLDWQDHLDRFLVLDRAQCAQDQLAIVAERIDPRRMGDIRSFAGLSAVEATEENLPELLAKLENMSPRIDARTDGEHRVWIQPLEEVWHSDVAVPIARGVQAFSLRSRPEEWMDDQSGLTFVKVGGGTFRMGTDEDYQSKTLLKIYDDEMPAHPVSLSGFWMAAFEIDGRSFRKYTPNHRSTTSGNVAATEVSWSDARDFCEAFGHRLPSEAEWEYAVRAGSATLFHFGGDPDRLGSFAWYGSNANRTQSVGRKKPNPLGLHDMHGNVREWVQDDWNESIYQVRVDSGLPVVDPVEKEGSAEGRVVRGGSWVDGPEFQRSAYRDDFSPSFRLDDVGFRCASSLRRQP